MTRPSVLEDTSRDSVTGEDGWRLHTPCGTVWVRTDTLWGEGLWYPGTTSSENERSVYRIFIPNLVKYIVLPTFICPIKSISRDNSKESVREPKGESILYERHYGSWHKRGLVGFVVLYHKVKESSSFLEMLWEREVFSNPSWPSDLMLPTKSR